MKKWSTKVLLVILTLLFLPLTACGEGLEELYLSRSDGTDYAAYQVTHADKAVWDGEPISLYASEAGESLAEGDGVTFTFTLEQDVFGYPVFSYAMTDSNILDNVYSLVLDGAIPYSECETLTLDSMWTTPGTFEKDRYGNEVVSMPEKYYDMTTCRMLGKAVLYSKGMGLYIPAGEHTMTITCREGPFRLHGVTLEKPLVVAQQPANDAVATGSITIQAETVPMRNNPNVRPAADYNIALTPYSSGKKVINYIEDISYRYAGDEMCYTFTVEESGWYGMSLRMRQSELPNFPVFRTILLDGVVPGEAFDTVPFDYCLDFTNAVIRDANGDVAKVYLEAGEHTLSLVTTLDPVRPALNMLNVVSGDIANLALDITKITGGNTDFFRDFALEDFDFHIAEDLAQWIGELEAVYADLAALSRSEGDVGALSSLELAIDILNQLTEKPNDLPKKLNLFSTGSSSARAMLVGTVEDLLTSPMGLDSITFFTDESQLPVNKSFAEQTGASVERFFASFGEQNYAATAGEEGRLQVWVNRPRQYLEIMQRMADTTFTPMTGIAVDFSIMPDESKLILANASGGAPDVALGVSTGRVYDLAVRGALMNLRQYDGAAGEYQYTFKEVGKWFPTGLLIPGVCDDGVYALPETFNFYVLFYRQDILDNLGLEVPNSYEEVLGMLPTLHRYGLNFNSYVANSVGYKSFSITTPFIFQAGGKMYEDGNINVLLDSEAAIEGIRLMTDSYLIYDMPYEVSSFYQSFRDGTLPIGTSNYGMYNMLMNAAPELADKWGIALYPGITNDEGEVLRYTSGAEQSDFIFATTDMPQESWEFLSWWMSEEVQTEFAYTLQSTLGNEYLWNSANTDAFMNSPWPTEHKKIIAEQMTWTYEAPRMPGSYMVERELSNAVNAVALEGQNLRAALDEAIKRIDREVERKLEEFGRLKNGELLQPFVVPDLDVVKGWLE